MSAISLNYHAFAKAAYHCSNQLNVFMWEATLAFVSLWSLILSSSTAELVAVAWGGLTIWRYSVFANFLGGDTVIWIKNGRYSVFQSPNGDGKIQFLIENTTVTVFIQKFDYGITVIFEKINGNTVIQNLVRPPVNIVDELIKLIGN